MKLAVFDFDSTLMNGETLDILAGELGLQEKVSKITEKGMKGEIDFFESLIKRVKLLKGLEVKKVDKICQNLPWMPGAQKVVSELKNKSYRVMVFSGGFRNATANAQKVLGFDGEFANILHSKDGILTGKVGGEMMFDSSKGEMLQRIQKLLGISKENTLVAGDGANDKSMFKYAEKRVAFCAKEALKKEANIIVDNKDLTKILNYI